MINNNQTRINKAISQTGFCSRRKAEELIKSGKVTVNGKIIQDLSFKVNENDELRINNEIIKKHNNFTYILFYKPKGYITTKKDEKNRKTIFDILPKKYSSLNPAGRLDKDSEGLLILSNDGDFIQKIIHPKNKIYKRYIITVDTVIKKEDMIHLKKRMIEGLNIGNEIYRIDNIMETIDKDKKQTKFEIVLHEGKNRHIRKMIHFMGLNVISLIRVEIGQFTLKGLKKGKFIEITENEANSSIKR